MTNSLSRSFCSIFDFFRAFSKIQKLVKFIHIFRTVDMNTMIRIDDPELDNAEADFEKLLVEGDE